MGGFYDSIHVRTESYHLVKDILTKLAKSKGYKFYLAPAINNWISLFPNDSQQQSLSCEISSQINADVLQMTVYDDDIFSYLYCRGGGLIDEYNSCPDYFGEKVSTKERKRLKGRPEVFRELVGTESKVKKIRKILKPKTISDTIKVPNEMKEQFKKAQALFKTAMDMVNDQNAVLEFIKSNPELLKDQFASFVTEVGAQKLKSMDEIQKLFEKNEKAQHIGMKILEKYVKSCISSKEFDSLRPDLAQLNKAFADAQKQVSDQIVVDDKGNIRNPQGLFSSETMSELAQILGIPNVITSYEYLKAGQTDGIKEWEQFIEIA